MYRPTFSKILFVINPISGGTKKDELKDSLASFCQSAGLEHEIFKTTGEDDKARIGEKIQAYKPDAVFAIGGDGTVNLVASILAGTEIAMGIIPMGSGNGLAKDLLIPQNDHEAALKLLENPVVKRIDTLSVNGHFFLHLCDLGFNAHVVKMFAKSQQRGLLSYMKFTLLEFFNYPSFGYTLYDEEDKEVTSGKAFMITCANSNMYGSNIVINPEGRVGDGKFEVVVIKDFKWYNIFKMIALLIVRKIHRWEMSRTVHCSKARITLKKKKTLQYDGELADEVNEIKVSITPSNLHVICQEHSPV